jgi:glycosyltransferase domain-containing protein
MNITIMIPTKNRPSFILRQLKYYSLANFQGEILIGDSSDTDYFDENKKNINKFEKELSIKHFNYPRCPPDKALYLLSCEVQTDYSAFVADDDIILVESISECINFLDSHVDYSAVHGKAYLMSLADGKGDPYGKLAPVLEYQMATIKEDTALGRINEFFANVLNINMAVIRSKINVDAFKEVEKLSDYYSIYVFGELIHGSIVCSRGKIGQIDNCYLVRQSHLDQAFGKLNFGEWFSRGEWCEQFNILKSTINKEVLEIQSNKDISNKISLILSSWLEFLINNHSAKREISPSIRIRKMLSRHSFFRFLKRLFFNKNILNIVINEKLIFQNDIRKYIDIVEDRNTY